MSEEGDSISSQIQKLQEHLTFLDEHVSQQDKEILSLQKKLDKSVQELKELRDHFNSGALSMGSPDEKPPHY